MEQDVFISLVEEDIEIAEKLHSELKKANIGTWIYYKSIPSGKDYIEAITDGINEAKVFVLIISEASNYNWNVSSELQLAFNNNIPIFPFKKEDIELSSHFTFFIGLSNIFDAVDPPIENKIKNFVKDIESSLNANTHDLDFSKSRSPNSIHGMDQISCPYCGNKIHINEEQIHRNDNQKLKDIVKENEHIPDEEIFINNLQTFKHNDVVFTVSISADGKKGVSGGKDKTIKFCNLESGELLKSIEHQSNVRRIKITSDGNKAISLSRSNLLRSWDLTSGECQKDLKIYTFEEGDGHTDKVTSLDITPDGNLAVTGSEDFEVKLWNMETGKCLQTFSHNSKVESVSIDSKGIFIISGSDDGIIKIWNIGKSMSRNFSANSAIKSVTITPDGTRAAYGTYRSLKILDINSGKVIKTIDDDPASRRTMIITPDSQKIISSSVEKIKVFDIESATILKTLEGHTGWVTSLDVSKDGHILLSGSRDKTVRLWAI